MRIFLFLLFFFTFFTSKSQNDIGWMLLPEKWIELDKQMHFTGGAFIGSMSYMVTLESSLPETYALDSELYKKARRKSKIVGILLTTLVATLKETSDINTTGFDLEDLGYSVAGGLISVYTFDFIIHRAKKRNRKFEEQKKRIDAFYED